MATNGYPHMVFVQPDAGLDKETLAVFLEGLFPDADVADKPLRVDMSLGGYVFSFWLEEAEGVADRYAVYLPEGARRRWLSRCESMIDLHGQPDPDGVHAAKAQRIVTALQAQEGIEVFSEETRRFLGMDYGDSPAEAPAPAPVEVPQPAPPAVAYPADAVPEAQPATEFAPRPAEPVPAAPAAGDAVPTASPEPWAPATEGVPAASPDPAAQPAAASVPPPDRAGEPAPQGSPDPSTVWMPAAPDPNAPAAQPDAMPAEAAATAGTDPEQAEEKKGFFKRVFGRRTD